MNDKRTLKYRLTQKGWKDYDRIINSAVEKSSIADEVLLHIAETEPIPEPPYDRKAVNLALGYLQDNDFIETRPKSVLDKRENERY